MLEMILVLVIIAAGTSMALPSLSRSVENREAKKALDTLRSLSHAIRLNDLDHGGNCSTNIGSCPKAPADLEALGYLDRTQFYNPNRWHYMIDNWSAEMLKVWACRGQNCNINPQRRISVEVFSKSEGEIIKGRDGRVTDSGGFLGPTK